MEITNLEQITKTKIKVYIDNEYHFWLYQKEVYRYDLHEGDMIEESLYQEIIVECVLRRAKLKVLNWLKVKDRTENELRIKLKQDGFLEAIIDHAIDYVKGYHYVDDQRYLENYIDYHGQHKSKKMLKYQLLQKGLSSDDITAYLEELSIDETEQIKQIVHKKYQHIDIKDISKKRKIINYLLQKGYNYADVNRVLSEISESEAF